MSDLWLEIFQYVLSITSGLMLWKMGDKSVAGPVIGAFSQILWLIYIIITKQFGLVPGVLLFTFVHFRNIYIWSRVKTTELKEG